MAAIVVPPGDRSIAITRDCLDPESALLTGSILVTVGCNGPATFARRDLTFGNRFFADVLDRFGIGNSLGSTASSAATTEAPPQ